MTAAGRKSGRRRRRKGEKKRRERKGEKKRGKGQPKHGCRRSPMAAREVPWLLK